MSLTKSDLIHWFEEGSKKPEDCYIGTEHEVFVYHLKTWQRVGYPDGIEPIFQELEKQGWTPIFEKDKAIALSCGEKSITLEPAGQFELSGKRTKNLHETKLELDHHISLLQDISQKLNLAFVPLGFEPLAKREDLGWMPKERYDIMRAYMPTKGSLGLDMMTRTCTVQANLDYTSETDMVSKIRLSMALQPLVSALFASSPFYEGKLSGYKTYRERIWQDTDPDRCGLLPFVFEPSMGFERYVDYLLKVPMYFVYKEKKYINQAGHSFLNYMEREEATLQDWTDHVTTAFPEVRLKRYLELRGADSGPEEFLIALPSLWVGLFYDSSALDQGLQLIQDWSIESILKLYHEVPQKALQAEIQGRPLKEVALDVLGFARQGLKNRGLGEEIYLLPIEEIAHTGWTLADRWIDAYQTRWNQDVRQFLLEHKF